MKIEHIRTNHIENPMGYLIEKPVFSYKVTEAKGKKQKYGQYRFLSRHVLRTIYQVLLDG
jgi:alpha-L-rhamnosidase